MFRNRTYSTSIFATFLVSFGFFGAIIFLPRWFQFVNGSSATESGYQIFPLLLGLIASSIVSGILVSRTGRYKAIILSGLAIMSVGLVLLTQLTATTELPTLWLWMFITGIGIGPTLSVFTIVVQNAVPFSQLGVATSNLTFFRQIGGSIGLALTGTIFGTRFIEELPVRMVAAGVPAPAVAQFAGGSTSVLDDLVGVGGDLGAQILATMPAALQDAVRPLIPAIVQGIHEAFSAGVASSFQLGVVTTVLAFVVALAMRELPLRSVNAPPPEHAQADEARGTLSRLPATE
jgi:MFS family permease